MKSLLFLCLFVAAAYSLPAKHSDVFDSSEESFFILPFSTHSRQHKKDVPSVVEVDVGSDSSDEDSASYFPVSFKPFLINPFSFMNFGFSDFFSRPTWFDSFMPKEIPEAAVKNSTSNTKIVDGHQITVNDTTYENEKNGAVYRFQVIEVRPVESKEKDNKDDETGGSNNNNNEDDVAKGSTEKTLRVGSEEAVEGENKKPAAGSVEEVKPDSNSQDNEIHREEVPIGLSGSEGSLPRRLGKRETVVDLSGDLRVNRLLMEDARRGNIFMIPPDVELLNSLDYDQLSQRYQQVVEPFGNQEVVKPEFKPK